MTNQQIVNAKSQAGLWARQALDAIPFKRFGLPEQLAVIRWATGLYALVYLLPRHGMFSKIFRSDPELFDPVGLAHFLSGPLSPSLMDGVYILTVVLALAFTVGAWFRYVGPAFALVLLALLSYRNSWSMVLHMHNGLVVHVALLAFARCSEAWSLDAFRRAKPAVSTSAHKAALTWLAVVTLVPYFLSGLAKIMGPDGFSWVAGESLRDQVAVNALRYHALVEGSTAHVLSAIAEHGWFFTGMGIFTLLLEIGAPLVLLHPRLAIGWVLLTWATHWGIYLVMGIVFRHQMWGVFFIPVLLYGLGGLGPGRRRTSSPEMLPPSEGRSAGASNLAVG